jgi:cytochrome o ubiquinol oxidase subunit 3
MSEDSEAVVSAKVARKNEQLQADSKTMFGFWTYLMTDCVLFASLFATFAVLHSNTYGGPSAHALFSLPYALAETLILLFSSFTCGLAILSAQTKSKRLVLFWLFVTLLLGAAFLVLEIREFTDFVHKGDSWRRSGFLSSYFTLVATHGLHITVGLLWIITMIVQVFKKGLNRITVRQLTLMSLFWHFLDLIWIFIFSVVYLISGGLNI